MVCIQSHSINPDVPVSLLYLLVQSDIWKKRETLLKHCLKTVSGEPDVPSRKGNREDALENRGRHYWSVTVSMECYMYLCRLLTMSRHTTLRQQTIHYRVQVSTLLLHYWVLVLVPAIRALSDYGVYNMASQPTSM